MLDLQPITPPIGQLTDVCAVICDQGAQTRYWRKEEHERFLEALEKYVLRQGRNRHGMYRSPTDTTG